MHKQHPSLLRALAGSEWEQQGGWTRLIGPQFTWLQLEEGNSATSRAVGTADGNSITDARRRSKRFYFPRFSSQPLPPPTLHEAFWCDGRCFPQPPATANICAEVAQDRCLPIPTTPTYSCPISASPMPSSRYLPSTGEAPGFSQVSQPVLCISTIWLRQGRALSIKQPGFAVLGLRKAKAAHFTCNVPLRRGTGFLRGCPPP